jgi:hypothetical protein
MTAGPTRPSFVPVAVSALVGAVTLTLLLVGAAKGWLGPDVDRGGFFCEAERDCLLKQPANSLSNLGFVVAGLAIAWHARRPEGQLARPRLATLMAVVVTLLGPASMAMHATESALGGRLDMLSMYLVAGFATAYAVMRLVGGGVVLAGTVFVGLVVLCEVVATAGSVPVVGHAGNAVFALLLVTTAAIELALRSRCERDDRWGYWAVGVMVAAFGIWLLSHDGGLLCDPHSLLQGHAVWHLLSAVAAYCLYRLYASERCGTT